jgi:hypothetical protein
MKHDLIHFSGNNRSLECVDWKAYLSTLPEA